MLPSSQKMIFNTWIDSYYNIIEGIYRLLESNCTATHGNPWTNDLHALVHFRTFFYYCLAWTVTYGMHIQFVTSILTSFYSDEKQRACSVLEEFLTQNSKREKVLVLDFGVTDREAQRERDRDRVSVCVAMAPRRKPKAEFLSHFIFSRIFSHFPELSYFLTSPFPFNPYFSLIFSLFQHLLTSFFLFSFKWVIFKPHHSLIYLPKFKAF